MGLGTASISFIGRSTRPLGHTWPVEPPKICHPSFGTHECHNMSHLDSRGFSCCQQSRPNSLVKRLAKHLAQKTPTFGCTFGWLIMLIAGGLQRADRWQGHRCPEGPRDVSLFGQQLGIERCTRCTQTVSWCLFFYTHGIRDICIYVYIYIIYIRIYREREREYDIICNLYL